MSARKKPSTLFVAGAIVSILLFLLVCGLALVAWRLGQAGADVHDTKLMQAVAAFGQDAPDSANETEIARGAYLARAGDCIACHTASGGQPFAGGLPMKTPFGVIVSSNITPDKTYGIGAWSDAEFLRAVKRGVAPHDKLLYPAMPYNLYSRVSDQDLLAVRRYLETVPAANVQPPPNRLPFPFNIRLMMAGWNLLFFNPAPFVPDATQSVEWNRGRYLVDGLGHCTACHSGKNFLGGDVDYLQGYDLEGWHAPEITGDARLGLGKWTTADIAAYLQTGGNDHAVAAATMAEAVTHSTQYLNDADAKAIATYLHSLPGSATAAPAPLSAEDERMVLGHALFQSNCAACHRANGEGVNAMVPRLADSAGVQAPGANNLVRTILEGGRGAATARNPTSAQMPAFAWKLSDAQVAAVSTYVRNSWGNAASAVDSADVTRLRKQVAAAASIVP